MRWLALAFASAANAGTVTGTVRNGTTGKPAANVEMILIQLQGGMQPVAKPRPTRRDNTRSIIRSLGAGPMLLRAVYRGVNYHEPVTPGKNMVDMQVFEPTDKPGAVTVSAHAIILQPDGSDLDVGEEYNITNKTQPSAGLLQGGWLVRFFAAAGCGRQSGLRREFGRNAGDSDPDR